MKVFLHMEQLLYPLPIYHVAVQYNKTRYDFHPKNIPIPTQLLRRMKRCPRRSIYIGKTSKSHEEVNEYILKNCKTTYMFPIYDCRHYTQTIIDYTNYDNNLHLTNPLYLYNLFENI